MKIVRNWCVLLCGAMFLSGFTWGFGGDRCKEAADLTEKLDSLRDDQLAKAEARVLSLCPDGAAAHYVTALQLERVGNVDGAIREYRMATQQQFPLASGNLGLLYAQKGMNDEASVELARGLSARPNPRYHKAMGLILADRKVYTLAIYHLNEAARGLPRDSGIFAGLGQIYHDTGQPDKALEEYRRALAADPANDKASVGIATIHLVRNEPDKALEELRKAELANPLNREIHLIKAGIYEKQGQAKLAEYEYLLGGKGKSAAASPEPSRSAISEPPVAATDLDKAVGALRGSLLDSPEKAAETYEKLGNLYRSAGKDTEAIAAYREAAYRNTTSSDVYLNLGILYEKQAKHDEAVVAYKQAIQTRPDKSDARLRLADIYFARGSYPQAVEQYSEFLKLKPDSPDIQLKLARLFVKNKEAGLAIDAYNAVLKASPDNVDANREIAPLYKAKGMNDKATENYKKVLVQQKDDVETRNALVAIYVKNKQYDEITVLLKGTAELFPDDPNNHYKLGLIYEFKKDYDNAAASYKKAVELKTDHARSLNALGRLYMKTGRIAEAKEVLEAAKKADPSLEETAVLLNNIGDDEFNPEPRKISKKIKGKRSKKAKKSKKASKSSKGSKKSSSAKKSVAKDKGQANKP